MQLVSTLKNAKLIVMTTTIFVGKCTPDRTCSTCIRKDSHTNKSRVILVRMKKLELDTHSITYLFINIIEYIIRDFDFAKKNLADRYQYLYA